MTSIDTPLHEGDVIHLWLKPVGAERACVTITLDGGAQTTCEAEATAGYLPATWTSPTAGLARLDWSEDVTDVSVVYAFTPATVTETGIRVLRTTARNAIGDARTSLHFHPPFGWMNDPNGLCEIDGATHLFHQHNPHGRRWGTMHWGHAISRDGISWVHQPVALFPNPDLLRAGGTQGGAFSGTILPRPDGSMRLFYTDRDDERLPTREWQMTAVCRDGQAVGPATPILDTHPPVPGYRNDWRDPFVFAGPDGRLKMLLGGADTGGSIVLLYETGDPEGATGWRFVEVLFREAGRRNIPAECPAMIPLAGDGEGLWVLIFGLIGSRDEATGRRNLTRTHIGRFDGRRFEALYEHDLDFGTDCYAMQFWSGRDGPCGIAWAANWTDVFADRDFESAMTFPRRLIWDKRGLRTPPIAAVDDLRERHLADLAEIETAVILPNGRAEVDLTLRDGAPFTLSLDHPTHEMALVYDGADLEFRFEPPGNRTVPRYRIAYAGLRTLRVFIDVGLIEIYVDDGRRCCTKRFDDATPVRAVRLTLDREHLETGTVWALRLPPAS